jgi:hypothetical protein
LVDYIQKHRIAHVRSHFGSSYGTSPLPFRGIAMASKSAITVLNGNYKVFINDPQLIHTTFEKMHLLNAHMKKDDDIGSLASMSLDLIDVTARTFPGAKVRSLRDVAYLLRGKVEPKTIKHINDLNVTYSTIRHLASSGLRSIVNKIIHDIESITSGVMNEELHDDTFTNDTSMLEDLPYARSESSTFGDTGPAAAFQTDKQVDTHAELPASTSASKFEFDVIAFQRDKLEDTHDEISAELKNSIAQLQAQNMRMQAFSPTHISLAETLFEVPPQVEDELWQQLLKVSSLDEELQPTHADHAQCQLQSHSRSLHEVLRRFAAAFDAAVQQHAIFDEPPDMLVTSDLWDFEFYADYLLEISELDVSGILLRFHYDRELFDRLRQGW